MSRVALALFLSQLLLLVPSALCVLEIPVEVNGAQRVMTVGEAQPFVQAARAFAEAQGVLNDANVETLVGLIRSRLTVVTEIPITLGPNNQRNLVVYQGDTAENAALRFAEEYGVATADVASIVPAIASRIAQAAASVAPSTPIHTDVDTTHTDVDTRTTHTNSGNVGITFCKLGWWCDKDACAFGRADSSACSDSVCGSAWSWG